MIKIYKYRNTFILDNTLGLIKLLLLGRVINRWLKDAKSISDNDTITRCREYDNYIIIAPYGSLVDATLLKFIKDYLKATNCSFIYEGELPEYLINTLKDYLPRLHSYEGSQCGGPIEDSFDIDPGVKPLCDVLNSIPEIETFSSCEGHKTTQPTSVMYVLFTISGNNRFDTLNELVFILDLAFSEVWSKLSITNILPRFLFGQGHWPEQSEVYFEIRIDYHIDNKELVFTAINDVSNVMINRIKEKKI